MTAKYSIQKVEIGLSKGSSLRKKSPRNLGGRHSFMVLSAPTIMRSQVQITSTPFMLFLICIIEIVMRKGQKYTNRVRDRPILKNTSYLLSTLVGSIAWTLSRSFINCSLHLYLRFDNRWETHRPIGYSDTPSLVFLCRCDVNGGQCDHIWRFIGLWATF